MSQNYTQKGIKEMIGTATAAGFSYRRTCRFLSIVCKLMKLPLHFSLNQMFTRYLRSHTPMSSPLIVLFSDILFLIMKVAFNHKIFVVPFLVVTILHNSLPFRLYNKMPYQHISLRKLKMLTF